MMRCAQTKLASNVESSRQGLSIRLHAPSEKLEGHDIAKNREKKFPEKTVHRAIGRSPYMNNSNYIIESINENTEIFHSSKSILNVECFSQAFKNLLVILNCLGKTVAGDGIYTPEGRQSACHECDVTLGSEPSG